MLAIEARMETRTVLARKLLRIVPLVLILAVAAALRLYGLNWDGGQWLHPDERQIYFSANDLAWPQGIAQAFAPSSPLNPHFFAYGSLPIYLLRLIAVVLGPIVPAVRDPGNLHLVGRPLAALLDLGTVALTFWLARQLPLLDACHESQGLNKTAAPNGCGEREGLAQRQHAERDRGALLAAALFSLAVLPVQLAHFYTVDTLLTFEVMLALNLAAGVARGGGWRWKAALGAVLGLALSTKLTAAPLVLVVIAAVGAERAGGEAGRTALAVRGAAGQVLGIMAVAAVTWVLVQPYAVIDWRTFLSDTLRESQIAWGRLDVPYTRQYAGTLPFVYSMWQTALWGMGLPLGLLAWGGFAASLVRWLRSGAWADALLLAWAAPYLALVGLLYARPLRYMLPLIPALCIAAAWLVADIGFLGHAALAQRQAPAATRRWGAVRHPLWAAVAVSLVILTLAYALAFARLYAAPHPWAAASEWIYRNVPAGSTLLVEEWDTPLPLPLDVEGRARRSEEYNLRTLAVYEEPDGAAKWAKIAADLASSDYVVIASRRAHGSLLRLSGRYPVTGRAYAQLFSGELGFAWAGEFTRGPAWLGPRSVPLPGAAPSFLQPDESFVVYDHPRTVILRNTGHLPAQELLGRLALP
jgi:hypothetical protein